MSEYLHPEYSRTSVEENEVHHSQLWFARIYLTTFTFISRLYILDFFTIFSFSFCLLSSHATTSKLGDLWRNGNFRQRQKIQNLVYPDGIFYDKDSEDYRTDSVNPALEILRRFTDSCVGDKRKADLEMLPNLPLVEYSGLEPLTSTLPVLRSPR